MLCCCSTKRTTAPWAGFFIVLTLIFATWAAEFPLPICCWWISRSTLTPSGKKSWVGRREQGHSEKLQRLNWRSATSHRVRLITTGRISGPLKLKVGMAQGSNWSPKNTNVFGCKIATTTDVPRMLQRRDNTIYYLSSTEACNSTTTF